VGSETWALVGVVVGAILGGVAQVVGDAVRHGREKQTRVRDEQREAYIEFIGIAETALLPLSSYRHAFDTGTAGVEGHAFADLAKAFESMDVEDRKRVEAGILQQVDRLHAGRDALGRLSIALVKIHLVAPGDTYLAASRVATTLMKYQFKDEDGMAEELATRLVEFQSLAKRDLALTRSRA